ncbi:MAG: radical SAM protein [Candidatus Omnitrophota bacterium]|nr:radical SAM protein [Candidatus Omnitrophota bacterium]
MEHNGNKRENKEKIALFPGMAGLTRDIIERMKSEGVKLLSLDIMVTQKCNFCCSYCYAEGSPAKTNELSMKEAMAIVDEAIGLGVRIINMQGGEPLMWHPADWKGKSGEALFHLMEYIRGSFAKKGLPLDLVSFTDVALITEEKARRLAGLGVALCCKLDSLDQDIQDKLLGTPGGAKKMMQGFNNLIMAGYGSKDMPTISTNTVVTTLNYGVIKDVFRWSRSHGFRPFVIPVHVHGRAKENSDIMLSGKETKSTLSPKDIKTLFEELAKIDREEFGINWEPLSPWIENKACSRHLGGVHIRADGVVVPCSEAPDRWALGDIRKQSLSEIVLSEKVEKFRQVYSQLHEHSKCSPNNCPLSAAKKCYGCRTRAYDESAFDENGNFDAARLNPDSFFAGDPACWRGTE